MSMNDDELRDLWRRNGGRFFGPHVETGAMTEEELLPFLRSLVAQADCPYVHQRGIACNKCGWFKAATPTIKGNG